MKPRLPIAACLPVLFAAPLAADEIKHLLCLFRYGQIQVEVNYSAQTVNGVTAIIDDKEIIWTPPGENKGMAVINRYTGLMQISRGAQEFTGMCNQIVPAE